MLTRALRSSATAFVCLVAACSSGSSNNPAPGASPSPATLPGVQVTLDTARAVSATVSAGGATLVAKAANGATLTLTVPPGAFSAPVAIRMTPIVGVTGSPLSGPLISGVHFEPEGLQFVAHATLAIRPATSVVPASGQSIVGFGYSGLGDSFQLVPVSGADTATEATIEIAHFSGYGTGVGTGDEIDAMLSAMAANILALAMSAESSEHGDGLDEAYREYSAWLAMANARPGKHDAESSSISVHMANAVALAVQRAKLDCYNDHDPSKAQTIIDWASWALARPEIMLVMGSTNLLLDAAQKCARFELSFDVTYTVASPDGTIAMQATATVPLNPMTPPPPFLYSASGPLAEAVQQWPWIAPPGCTQSVQGIGSTLTVMSATIDPGAAPGTRGVTVALDPGTPNEQVSFTCPDSGTAIAAENVLWFLNWTLAHQSERDPSTGAYVITNWQPGSGDGYAEATYAGPVPGTASATENGKLTLRHVPLL